MREQRRLADPSADRCLEGEQKPANALNRQDVSNPPGATPRQRSPCRGRTPSTVTLVPAWECPRAYLVLPQTLGFC